MLFDFFNMMGTYEQRKVENTKVGDVEIDTAAVTDSEEPYETGITSPRYGGDWIIVEMYETKEDAIKGHERWVEKMANPPAELKDVSTSEIKKLLDAFKDNTR